MVLIKINGRDDCRIEARMLLSRDGLPIVRHHGEMGGIPGMHNRNGQHIGQITIQIM